MKKNLNCYYTGERAIYGLHLVCGGYSILLRPLTLRLGLWIFRSGTWTDARNVDCILGRRY